MDRKLVQSLVWYIKIVVKLIGDFVPVPIWAIYTTGTILYNAVFAVNFNFNFTSFTSSFLHFNNNSTKYL